jgi:hypothetical protein
MEKHEIELLERQRIVEVLGRLLEFKKATKDECSKLWQIEKESTEEYTVLDRLDLISADIIGYVSGINSKYYRLNKPEKVINHLHRLSIFDVECIIKWYPTAAEEYPKIKHYFELLDYIRLLTLDYIQRYQLQETTTK